MSVSMKADVMAEVDDLVAMPLAGAARLAGVSERQLNYWDENGLLSPGVRRRLSPRNHVRLYDFQDLLELLVIKALQDANAHTRVIRRVVEHLRSRGYERPLTELRFAVVGKRVYFQHPDGSGEGDAAPDQVVLWQVLQLEPLRQRIRDAASGHRHPDLAGEVVKQRGTLGSKAVFAGTRTPVEALWPYLRRGYSTEDILRAFPHLSERDVDAARGAMPAA